MVQLGCCPKWETSSLLVPPSPNFPSPPRSLHGHPFLEINSAGPRRLGSPPIRERQAKGEEKAGAEASAGAGAGAGAAVTRSAGGKCLGATVVLPVVLPVVGR